MISANITASLYLVTGILFIMALRGLSSPETSRTGNFLGILGMTLAVIVTLLSLGDINQIKENIIYILVPIILGGLIGGVIAFRVSMTAMPQLVAGFHSLVGLSAVLVGIVAFYNPASFGIGQVGNIKVLSLVEMSLGVAIGAITFSGSCIAFLKLQGLMSGNPITSMPPGTVLVGELGLGGQLRPVGQLELRLVEAARLGFTRAVVPKGTGLAKVAAGLGLQLLEASTVAAALVAALGVNPADDRM